ncbi:MAG: DEAD/DEAH box helicase, partial [Myxococcales bacterium]|nr:DEAD/DEAH box helicase [Myxococcales bacterium]
MGPPPSSAFDVFGLDDALLHGVADAGFSEPRSIQSQTIPAALAGRDVLGLAETGSGKTAAFGLPLLHRILATPSDGGARRPRDPRALIIAPTRELASQIAKELLVLGKHLRPRVVTVYGGVTPKRQVDALARGVDVVVACPGRLLDLCAQGEIRLDRVETLVLDEADHMFDMGFLPDVRRILAKLPRERQNLLFSATMPEELRQLAEGLLRDAVVVERDTQAPAATIEHAIFEVGDKQKIDLLLHLLEGDELTSAIVFTRTKHRAKRLAQKLDALGHRAVALQGNMAQNARDRAMQGFRTRQFEVLVATDIAARGIDVAGVSHVINFDVPNTVDAYTHRIGRTGRAERSGRAFTFATAEDRKMLRAIE